MPCRSILSEVRARAISNSNINIALCNFNLAKCHIPVLLSFRKAEKQWRTIKLPLFDIKTNTIVTCLIIFCELKGAHSSAPWIGCFLSPWFSCPLCAFRSPFSTPTLSHSLLKHGSHEIFRGWKRFLFRAGNGVPSHWRSAMGKVWWREPAVPWLFTRGQRR